MIIKVSFKIDDAEEPALAQWITSFKNKGRIRSYHIRQALKAYLSGSTASLPLLAHNPGNLSVPDLVIETGEIINERQELNETDLLAKLDSMF